MLMFFSLFVFFASLSHVWMSSRCRQAVQLKGALESQSPFTLGTTVAVEVTRETTANPNSFFYTVTFLSPHGDIPQLSFDTTAYVARAGAGAIACHTSHTSPTCTLATPLQAPPQPNSFLATPVLPPAGSATASAVVRTPTPSCTFASSAAALLLCFFGSHSWCLPD